jgi:hypothetical protein
MIESRYWKEELSRISLVVSPRRKPRRWTERAHCVVERDLMIGFFIIRRMIELHKVGPRIINFELEVFSCKNRGKNVTLLNRGDLDALYEVEKEKREKKSPFFMSNQFIHAYLSFVTMNEKRTWDSVYVVSDLVRNDCLWRVPVANIRSLFTLAASNYVTSGSYTYDAKRKDYMVTSGDDEPSMESFFNNPIPEPLASRPGKGTSLQESKSG